MSTIKKREVDGRVSQFSYVGWGEDVSIKKTGRVSIGMLVEMKEVDGVI